MVIKATIAKTLLSEVVREVRRLYSKNSFTVQVLSDDLENALAQHLKRVSGWSQEISFKELLKPKDTSDVYLHLDISLSQRRKSTGQTPAQTYSINGVFDVAGPNHVVILGVPGAGKTTTMKHICNEMLGADNPILDSFKVPLLVELRSLKDTSSIYRHIQRILKLDVVVKSDQKFEMSNERKQEVLDDVCDQVLDDMQALIVIDGLDEVSPMQREHFLKELRRLFANLNSAKVILTCRTAAYNIHLDRSMVFELCPLNADQIKRFIERYLGSDKKEEFLKQLQKTKFRDVAIHPLLLSHLCAIYERTGRIPEKPKTIWRKLLSLLIEEWDEQRSIKRESRYANFEADRKQDFLAQFAYHLTTMYDRKVYSEHDFKRVYRVIAPHFELPLEQSQMVIDELEAHTGIIIQSGYERFEFYHKSLQEYLAADYIVKLPTLPAKNVIDKNLSNELAIAVSLSSEPNGYFYRLCMDYFCTIRIPPAVTLEFMKRLIAEIPDFRVAPVLGLLTLKVLSRCYSHYDTGYGSPESETSAWKQSVVQTLKEAAAVPCFHQSLLVIRRARANVPGSQMLEFKETFNTTLAKYDDTGYVDDSESFHLPPGLNKVLLQL